MNSSVTIDLVTHDHGCAVLVVRGELDLQTAPVLYRRGLDAVGEGTALVLDLSGVGFCDSSGFNALLRLYRRAVLDGGGAFALVSPPEQISRLLPLTGGEASIPVHPSLERACQHVTAAPDARAA
ncbi:STAS domain-containing protein [Streptomyces genisteinicus]|uniref:Anti-sigma factor antagonist n=1 Tax=Streptomyces genisteinicus TaxID=2768068 RepID=A0A7H0I240_9ACTN|nr:STAS domain-containing protein [Streptomyces genisteinicus]QNP66856.1 STAS domain-containing protein [Streptomyces genisteinicus]